MRVCNICKINKELEEFSRNKSKKEGVDKENVKHVGINKV